MNREELKNIMPHREPMLLLDSCEKTGDASSEGRYQVTGDEFFLKGHFPGNPVVPGVIQAEIMAQSCAVIIASDAGEGFLPLFTGIKNIKFKGIVRPGDELIIKSRIVKSRKPFYFAESEIEVSGKTVCSGEISFALVKEDD